MNPVAKALRFWHTVRHLKPVQVYGRVRFRLSNPTPDVRAAPSLRLRTGTWVRPAERSIRMVSPTKLRFLNVERDLDVHGWDDSAVAKLWRYNLHYFDDLASVDSRQRTLWHKALIDRWIKECPPGRGTGWDPYPLSVRLVNWMKWILEGNVPSDACVASMAVQARWLMQRLEWHLLGNHLFMNAKALVYAGTVFEGAEAERWYEMGRSILERELREQILDDGGQFERSTMYHALALEDVLDLVNICRAFPGRVGLPLETSLRKAVQPMRVFLLAMTHPDGELALFNDAASGIAPSTAELERYSRDLGMPEVEACQDGMQVFRRTGMIRLQLDGIVAIIDVAPIGPDYLPGHAHADTLSCEVSVNGVRVLSNTGTSEYQEGAVRQWERSTAAHNTVVLNGRNSSDVYSAFRVGRRARPLGLVAKQGADQLYVACGHDGYSRLWRPIVHTRSWTLAGGRLLIRDEVPSDCDAVCYWRTGLDSDPMSDGVAMLRAGPVEIARVQFLRGQASVRDALLRPGFGVAVGGTEFAVRPESGAIETAVQAASSC